MIAPLAADIWQPLRYDFMRHALLAGTATALVSGPVGYFVVLRQLAFASDTLGDLAFPAALGALLLGINLRAGLFAVLILIALAMGVLGERIRGRDVAIGTVYAWFFGLGSLFLSLYGTHGTGGRGSAGISVLFGTIFGVTAGQAWAAVAVSGVVILALLAIVRPLLLASLLPAVAAARGVPVRALNVAFLILVAITVAQAVPAIGSLLVFALLVTPAAIAHRLTVRPAVALILSAALALLFVWVGLIVAFYTAYPVSFLITAIAFVTYVMAAIRRPAPWRLLVASPFRLRAGGRARGCRD